MESLPGQGESLRIEQVQMQAAEREQLQIKSGCNQLLTAMAAETDLIDKS